MASGIHPFTLIFINMSYLIPFTITLLITIPAVLAIKAIAIKCNIIDNPNISAYRRMHSKPLPLLGGIAIFMAFFVVLGYYIFFTQRILFPDSSILLKHIIGIFAGGAILMAGGFLEDKYNLKPSRQIIFPILAAIIVISAGLGIKYITNPFGGIVQLDIYKIVLFRFKGIPYRISLPSDIITFFWILGMIYTTKLLDGLDGLAAGITTIGAIVIFLASFSKFYVIPQVALMSAILAGSCVGFLLFNFNPAKIFLGEGGSTLCGFLLASLAILSQGKIAVTLLVMGIPILDVVWVIARRLRHQIASPPSILPSNTVAHRQRLCRRSAGRRAGLTKGGLRGVLQPDRKHLHHRLLDAGFSHRGAVIFLYCITGIFGVASLFLQSKGRGMALAGLVLVMVVLGVWVVRRY